MPVLVRSDIRWSWGHTHLQSTARNIGVDTAAAVYRAKEALSTEPKKPYQYLFPIAMEHFMVVYNSWHN